ncbi:MAG: polysaccharide biosynthesis tyrosine autokinase [Candidatus Eremiobacteraeota bacterium]|nr:polysaccharide biosynthesis tyrosine autokinase [Candidatus Eremiobacteraeota bacterium]
MFRLMRPPPEELPAPGQTASMGTGTTTEADVNSILRVLSRHRWAMFAIFATFLSLIVIFSLLTPRKYIAAVTLIAGNSGASGLNQQDLTSIPVLNALLASNGGQSPETYVALLQQRPLADAVIKDLKLSTGPRELLSHVSVTPVTNTAMLALKASWSDPQTAANIANRFADVFVERERDLVSGQVGSALEFLAKQLPTAEAKVKQTSAALAAYQVAHSLADINNQTQTVVNRVSAIESRIGENQVDKGQAQAQLASATAQRQSMASTIQGSATIEKNPILSQLQIQLSQVRLQLQSARNQYTAQHPIVIALRQQESELMQQIASQQSTVMVYNNIVPNPIYQQLNQQAATLRAQIAGNDAQIALLQSQLHTASMALKKLPVESLQLANLQRKSKLAEDMYNALQKKQSEALISKTTSLSDVAVTEPASADDVVVTPDLRFNFMVGFVVALVFSICGAFILDFLDNSIKDAEGALRELGLPVLTTVPKITAKNRAALPWLRALTVEAFILLITALRYSSDKPLRTLAITSPMQGDGKSTMALNTAVAMAEVRPKVLLVDGDMRRPSLHEKLQLPNHHSGLSDVLVGTMSLSSAVQSTRYTGLDFLSSGLGPPNAFRLLQSPRLASLVGEMLNKYEAVVFDTPALAGIMDALAIAGKVDGTVLVVSAGLTDIRSTKRALYCLENTDGVSLLGLILNQSAATRRDGTYSKYYVDGLAALPLADESEPEQPTVVVS